MVAYRLGIIPLMKLLKLAYPDVTHPRYSDDAGALGTIDNLERYFKILKTDGPDWESYFTPTKVILVVHPKNSKMGELFDHHHGFKVCTGALFIGVSIGDDVYKGD